MSPSPIPASCDPSSLCALVHMSPWGVASILLTGLIIGFSIGLGLAKR